MTVRIEADDIIQANTALTGASGHLRDISVIMSIAAEPFVQDDLGRDKYGSIFMKSAVLMREIARECPFTEGNAKTAWVMCATLLGLNGIDLSRNDEEGQYGPFVLQVAREEISLREAATYLALRVVR